MRRLFLFLLVLLLVLPSKVQSQKATVRAQLLEVGEFHGDQVQAKTSGGWLGLFVSKKASVLRLTSIRISRVFDPVIDDETKKLTGKKVSLSSVSAPVFLIKNVSSIKPGKVITVFQQATSFSDENPISLTLGDQQYRIALESGVAGQDFILGKAKIQLMLGGIKQTIFSGVGKDAGALSIQWAGDLDGDGKLDLYLDAMPHENVSSRRLLLSSQAGKGQLVREVARFETTGC